MKKMFNSKNYSYAMLVSLLLLVSVSGYSQIGVNGVGLPPPTPACTNCSNTTVSSLHVASTLGIGTLADDSAAFASGYYSQASGFSSSAIGNYCTANGTNSMALGKNSNATGSHSFALGSNVEARSSGSFAFGKYVKTTSSDAITIGIGQSWPCVDTLKNTNQYSIMFGTNSNLPTLFISNSGGAGKTGTIGIGNKTSPEAKLHIYGDADESNPEDASIYIESSSDFYSTIWMGDKSHYLRTKPNQYMEFNSGGNDFYFNNGDVGIGTDTPQSELDVDGRITTENLTITNNSASGRLLQSDDDGNASWVDPSTIEDGDWDISGSNVSRSVGNIGIGTSNPLEKLQIGDRWTFHDGGPKIIGYNYNYDGGAKRIVEDEVSVLKFDSDGDIMIRSAESGLAGSNINQWTDILILKHNGKVLIGDETTLSGSHKLYVNGSILSTEVNVAEVANWADYVFDDDYELPALSDVEQFVCKNKHLPDIPTESEVKENGINLGEMDALLLKKIEELTLYTIEQQKMLEEQRAEIDKLKAELSK